ncbi:MAG: hypothetical protein QOG64_3103 [Acidimicrobiaceae bacterium]|nr:hypothetical protein [Acidimicrobiaceae bacterium]
MSIDRARTLVQGVAQLPVMPAQADELLRVATDGDPEPRALLAIIERDPVLAAMVLRLVNSARYGLPRDIAELRQAVVLLGVPELRTLALAASMGALFSPGDGDLPDWDHAFSTACAARALAEELAPAHTEAAFVAGMLHDIGHLVISSSLAEAFPVVELNAATGRDRLALEDSVFGATHAELGAALAEHWSIPAHLVDAVADHHDPAPALRPSLGTLVFAAEALCGTFLPPADGGDVDSLAVLESLGATRPEAMALRIREGVIHHFNANDHALERS